MLSAQAIAGLPWAIIPGTKGWGVMPVVLAGHAWAAAGIGFRGRFAFRCVRADFGAAELVPKHAAMPWAAGGWKHTHWCHWQRGCQVLGYNMGCEMQANTTTPCTGLTGQLLAIPPSENDVLQVLYSVKCNESHTTW